MSKVDLSLVPQQAQEFRNFMAQFHDMFVNRGVAIDLMQYALLTQEHVLLFGDPGTSKTQICDAIFDGIDNAQKFQTEVSGFTGEDGVLGPYNVKVMREQGRLEHNIEGMLPEAKLARIGEFLDANGPLLRALLGAMNERRMLRGSQNIDMPLMTVYLDTNKDPAKFLVKNPDAWAVIDRIMFLEKLDYLSTPDDVNEMVTRYQRGVSRRPKIHIDVEVIENLSSLIVNPPGLITDVSILETYSKIVTEYREKRRQLSPDLKKLFILPEISDRRVNKASMVMEAEAILNGRLDVIVDDIFAAGIALCTSQAERDIWKETVETHVTEHKKRSASQLSTAQGLALKAIGERLEVEIFRADKNAKSLDLARTLQILSQQYHGVTPSTAEVHVLYEELGRKMKEALVFVQQRTLSENGLDGLNI